MLSDYLDIEAILRHHSGRVTVPDWYRAAWSPWAGPWLGCIWHMRAYKGRSDDGASSLQQCCCRHPTATAAEATTGDNDDTGRGTAAQCPAAMTRAGWPMTPPAMPRQSLCSPSSCSGLGGECLRESPRRGTGCCAGEISWPLPGWSQSPCSCGSSGSWHRGRKFQETIATWLRLLIQVGDLGHVPGVLEQDDVNGIQADGPVAGVFVKDVLDQMDDGRVIVMGPGAQHAGMGQLHVVDDDRAPWSTAWWSASPHTAAPRGKGPAGPAPHKPAACGCERAECEQASASWCEKTGPPAAWLVWTCCCWNSRRVACKRPLQSRVVHLIFAATGRAIVVGNGGGHLVSRQAGRGVGWLHRSQVQGLCVDTVIHHMPFKVDVGRGSTRVGTCIGVRRGPPWCHNSSHLSSTPWSRHGDRPHKSERSYWCSSGDLCWTACHNPQHPGSSRSYYREPPCHYRTTLSWTNKPGVFSSYSWWASQHCHAGYQLWGPRCVMMSMNSAPCTSQASLGNHSRKCS